MTDLSHIHIGYSPLTPLRLLRVMALCSCWIWVTDPLFYLVVEGRTDHAQWVMDVLIIGQLPIILAFFAGYSLFHRLGCFREGPLLSFTIALLIIGRGIVTLLLWNDLPARLDEIYGFQFSQFHAFIFEFGTHGMRLVALGLLFSLSSFWFLRDCIDQD